LEEVITFQLTVLKRKRDDPSQGVNPIQ